MEKLQAHDVGTELLNVNIYQIQMYNFQKMHKKCTLTKKVIFNMLALIETTNFKSNLDQMASGDKKKVRNP